MRSGSEAASPRVEPIAGAQAAVGKTTWALVALVVVALNLRAPISAVSAGLDAMQADLLMSGVVLSVLTTLPTLCLGVFAFAGPALRARAGEERLIAICTLVLLLGSAIRLVPTVFAVLAGTLIVVAALGVINVIMPALLKRWFSDRYVTMTALYTIVMTLGAAGASATMAPLGQALGSPWLLPLAVITVPLALLASGVWSLRLRDRASGARVAPIPPGLWRDPLAWHVTVFFGVLAMTSYFVLGWLPTIASDRGMSAAASGLVLSVSALVQAVGVLSVPVVIRRTRDQRLLASGVALLNAAGLAGVILMPVPAGVWAATVVLGLGQGAGFGLAMTVIGLRAATPGVAAGLSGMAQGVGYLLAILGPLGAGLLRSVTGGWEVPLVLLLVFCGIQFATGLTACRNRFVLSGAPATPVQAEGARP